ncbi:MAG TPA: polysaccharide deacetylase family protein [Povalibacter sp.]|nr:polysaccharide deacetylase family protein [Povalibacter sp.]
MSAVQALERGLLGLLSPGGPRARLLILTYHRVLAQPDALLPDEPDAATFAAQMDVVGAYCQVLALPEAVRRLRDGTLPPRAACITFDDGYENNLSVALPILEARNMSATIFIAAGAIEQGVMWNDLIIEGFRAVGAQQAFAHFGVDSTDAGSLAPAAAVLRVLEQQKYGSLEQRWRNAEEFCRKVSNTLPRLMLTREQIAEVARRGHDVGAHTIRHPILKELGPEAAREEIAGSYAWIAEAAGVVPQSFAYPNGRPGRDYDASHVSMAREAGFTLAVSTRWGCATQRSDPYQLPRCAPWDVLSPMYPLKLAHRYLRPAD